MSREFQTLTRRADVAFATQGLPPPSNVYIDAADELVIQSYGSAASVRVDVRGRLLLPTGQIVPIEIAHAPNSDRTLATTARALTEGFILSLSAFLGSGTAFRGQCYIIVSLARGQGAARFIHTILIQGYVGTAASMVWPGNKLEQPTEGPGFIRALTGTDPAAGVNVTETVPTGARWFVQSIRLSFVTDATVADRYVRLSFRQSTASFFLTQGIIAHAASLTKTYVWATGTASFTNVDITHLVGPLPTRLILSAADDFRTSIVNLQAGDDLGGIFYRVEEWIEP